MQASPVSPSIPSAQRKLSKYTKLALEHIRVSKYKGTTAEELWIYLNKSLPPDSPVSKASVINFLDTMKGKGLIHFTEKAYNGSHQKVYYPTANWEASSKESLQIII